MDYACQVAVLPKYFIVGVAESRKNPALIDIACGRLRGRVERNFDLQKWHRVSSGSARDLRRGKLSPECELHFVIPSTTITPIETHC